MTDSRIPQRHENQKMIEESLSTLVDGEASDLEVRRLLKACDENTALRQRWSRYQVISQVMKSGWMSEGDIPDISTDLSLAIKASIANESPIKIEQQSNNLASDTDSTRLTASKRVGARDFWPNIGRFAIAASVAAVVVLGVKYKPSTHQSVDAIATTPGDSLLLSEQIVHQGLLNKDIMKTASHSPSSGKVGIKSNNQPITISSGSLKKDDHDIQQLQRRLSRLMLEHVENTSQNNYQGILPYVRIPSGEE